MLILRSRRFAVARQFWIFPDRDRLRHFDTEQKVLWRLIDHARELITHWPRIIGRVDAYRRILLGILLQTLFLECPLTAISTMINQALPAFVLPARSPDVDLVGQQALQS